METAMAVEGFGVEAAFDRVPRRAQAPAIRQMMARGRASVLPRIVTAPSDEVYPCQQPDRGPYIRRTPGASGSSTGAATGGGCSTVLRVR